MIAAEHPVRACDVLYRDDALVVVNKPSGLATHRGDARDRVTLLSQLRSLVGRWVYPVHRLDRATSGLVLFAIEKDWVAPLQAQFEGRTVRKHYVALVRGVPASRGVIDRALPRDAGGPRVPAETHFELRGWFERFGWLALEPRTGRRHQLRRHLKHISHPIVGDVKYGKGTINRSFRERFGLHRLALHARALAFDHPVRGDRIEVEAPLPEDLREPLVKMGLVDSNEPRSRSCVSDPESYRI